MMANSSRHVTKAGRGLGRIVLVMATSLFLASCLANNSSAVLKTDHVPAANGTARVVLMPPDIELSELSAGGMREPNAAWTLNATSHVRSALSQVLAERNARLVAANLPKGSADQLVKLHGAVGGTILLHKYVPQFELPTKKGKFDWTLGPDAQRLAKAHKADYALFVYLRDSYSSDGRKALMVLGSLFGVGVSGGQQVGFASLVHLKTGDVVWFNRLYSQTGDLREIEPALVAVRQLLNKVPL